MDIYFQDGYGKLYEEIEGGIAEIFNYKSPLGEIKHQFIRREIPINLPDEKKYYDLITPYGYGGPLVSSATENKRVELCRAFGVEFHKYCMKNNIVSEFVRFHPIYNNAIDFKELYQATCIRKTLGTNLKDYYDPIQSEFSKSCRKISAKQLIKALHIELMNRLMK